MQQQQQHAVAAAGGTQQPQSVHEHREQELPGLAGIGSVIHWIEELVMLLSGPLLTIGLGIALIDLLTGGDLLRTWPFLLFTWGVCQAVGIDSQLVAMWDRARRAIRERHYYALLGYIVLGCLLGYVGFISAEAFGFQHAFAVSEAQALSRLGIDPISWQLQRAVLAVFLVALSGFTRYHPPAKNHSAKAADEAERLQAEIALAPLRAQLNAAKLRGVRTTVAAGFGREHGSGSAQPVASRPIAALASTLPPSQPPQAHHDAVTTAYKAMHDTDDWDLYDIPDEVEDDESTYSTRSLPEVREPAHSKPAPTWAYTGALAGEPDDFDAANPDDDDDEYNQHSRHQRKNGKTATGHKTQRQRTAELARQRQERQQANARDHLIDQAIAAVMTDTTETGEELSGYQLEDRVNEYLARMGSTVRTSRKTADKKRRIWLAQHEAHTTTEGGILSRNPASHELAEAWD